MSNANVEFVYGNERVELQLIGLSDADARELHRIFRKAAYNGSNRHIVGFGWWADTQGVMVMKGEST